MKSTANLCTSLTLSACFALPAFAADVTIPNQFSAGTPAVAAEVNDNFTAVKTAVDDNNSRVAQLEAELQSLQAAVASLQATNDQLSNFVANVLPYLRGAQDAQGNPAVFFSGANVHINNGEGSTPTINGTGNLIVGYDETTPATNILLPSFCTTFAPLINDAINATPPIAYTTQEACEAAGGAWTRRSGQYKNGSHNLVIGQGHNYTQYASLIAGKRNTAAAPMSFALGEINYALGWASSVTGGTRNITTGVSSSISGGRENQANGTASSISGGYFNNAMGSTSTVSGGNNNRTNGIRSVISGGSLNVTNGASSVVSGGSGNTTDEERSVVSGGISNSADGVGSVVSGGQNRTASGVYNWVAGSLFEPR